jgi:hypothetical protein
MNTITNTLNSVTAVSMTSILLLLISVDTLLAVRLRLSKGQFLSKTLGLGLATNFGLAVLPILIKLFSEAAHQICRQELGQDIYVLKAFAFFWTGLFAFATISSILTNLSILYPRIEWLTSLVEKRFKNELEKKIGVPAVQQPLQEVPFEVTKGTDQTAPFEVTENAD